MIRLTPRFTVSVLPLLWCCVVILSAQSTFEDVVRNLRNPDPKLRLNAVRLLREAQYPEALVPIAALINDPINEIQLEAIAAELSYFLVEELPARRRVALVVEVRNPGRAPAAFDAGPLAVWPNAAPPELISALLKAVDDDNQKVRLEAIYTLGIVARPPLAAEASVLLVKGLDHYDPAIRTGAARVIGRTQAKSAGDALIKAMNDSSAQVRYAAMRALGELREERAIQALTEQLAHYKKGEGAWSALDALARIAHPSTAEVFRIRLSDRDPDLRRAAAEGIGRAGVSSEIATLQVAATNDEAEMVRAAAAFALQKLGEKYLDRLVDFMDSDRTAPQIQAYLLELGPPIVGELVSRLQEPDAGIRRHVVEVLGAIGNDTTIAALTPLTQDRSRDVALAASRAIERIKMKE
jgi:HEAT repeat protein